MNNGWTQRCAADLAKMRAIVQQHEAPMMLVGLLGNMGDMFIRAGGKAALGDLFCRELHVADLPDALGDTLVIPGNGAFAPSHHGYLPPIIHEAAKRFNHVLILPATYDVSLEETRAVLRLSNVEPLAREQVSADAVGCRALLDCSVYAPLPKSSSNAVTLFAMRTDGEGRLKVVPRYNDDISATATSLSEWLDKIANVGVVATDRAHVMIAATLMGKRVYYREGNYFKNRALAEFMFSDWEPQGYPMLISKEAVQND